MYNYREHSIVKLPRMVKTRPATLVGHKISINDKENLYFRDKICMTKENMKKTLFTFLKKSVFCQILRVKNTDKIRMSGRSERPTNKPKVSRVVLRGCKITLTSLQFRSVVFLNKSSLRATVNDLIQFAFL